MTQLEERVWKYLGQISFVKRLKCSEIRLFLYVFSCVLCMNAHCRVLKTLIEEYKCGFTFTFAAQMHGSISPNNFHNFLDKFGGRGLSS